MDTSGAKPAGSYVQLGPPPPGAGLRPRHNNGSMDPWTAAVLRAVLLALAEQVNAEKLAAMRVTSPLDLTMLALSMAYRPDDHGLVGDMFEWSLLLAINHGETAICQMVTDALAMAGRKVDRPQAILVAAEGGRLIEYSPQVPDSATLSTGPGAGHRKW